MENIKYHINKICRVCKTVSSVMRYIFVKDGSTDDGPRIDEMLMTCSSVVVNYGDGLPNLICLSCNEQLTKAYQFKQLCENTDSTLREYLRDAQNCNQEMDIKIKSDPDEPDGGFSCSSDCVQFTDNELLSGICSKCFREQCKCDHKHICDICNKGFNQQDSLAVHKKLHDNKTSVLLTLENLDNISEHLEIEYCELNGNDMLPVFSNSNPDQDSKNLDFLKIQAHDAENRKPVKLLNNKDVVNSEAEIDVHIYTEFREDVLEKKSRIEEEMLEHKNKPQTNLTEKREDCGSGRLEYLPLTKRKSKGGQAHNNLIRKPVGRPIHKLSTKKVRRDNAKMSLLKKRLDKNKLKTNLCTTCNKKFLCPSRLKRHMLSHFEEKLFGCELCFKRFKRRDYLSQHMKLHTQDYKCKICEKLFSRNSYLVYHMSSKHNISIKLTSKQKHK